MSYAEQILHDLPSLYWRLGETSGTIAADASPHDRDGAYNGAPTLGVPGLVPGDADKAVTFQSPDQYLQSIEFLSSHAYATGVAVEAIARVDATTPFGNLVKVGTNITDALALLYSGIPNVCTDSSGYGHHGQYGADAGVTAAFQFQQPGLVTGDDCVFLNGDEILGAVAPTTFAGDFTLGGWLDDRGAPGAITLGQYGSAAGDMIVVDYQSAANPAGGFLFRLRRYYDFPNVQTYLALGSLTPGKHFWTIRHVAATGVTTFFVDGSSIGAVTQTAQAMVGTATDAILAGTARGSGITVDEAFIFSTALSDGNVTGLMTAAASGSTAWNTAVLALTPANFYHLNDLAPGNRVSFLFDDGAAQVVSGVGFDAPVGEAHHYVGRYDGANAQLYVDGVLYESASVGASIPTVPASSFVKIADDVGGLRVTLDEVAFYEYALSSDRIAVHAGLSTAAVDLTTGPTVRLVTERALVAPHQVERWTLPIICRNFVRVGPGEDIEQPQDVGTVRDFFRALRRTGKPVVLQFGDERHLVLVRDVSFPEGQVDEWGNLRKGLQGTLMVTVDAIDD